MIDTSKFDFIEELPVSEEMIGAFLEGKLMGAEMRDVSNFIENNSIISDIVNELEAENAQKERLGVDDIMQDLQMSEFNLQVDFNEIILPSIENNIISDIFTNSDEIVSSNLGNEIYESTEPTDEIVKSDNGNMYFPENEINL